MAAPTLLISAPQSGDMMLSITYCVVKLLHRWLEQAVAVIKALQLLESPAVWHIWPGGLHQRGRSLVCVAQDCHGARSSLGASRAGLSTLELWRRFPGARTLTGVDLSPHFLAVARVLQSRRGAPVTAGKARSQAKARVSCALRMEDMCVHRMEAVQTQGKCCCSVSATSRGGCSRRMLCLTRLPSTSVEAWP